MSLTADIGSICAALKVVASDKKDTQSHGGIGATSFSSMMRMVFGRGKAACRSVVNTTFMTGAAHDSSRNHLVVFAQAVVMTLWLDVVVYVCVRLCVCVAMY